MKNLVLIGMMGSGKTTVGRLLSGRLGLPLVDTDQLIEEREGRSIPDIFSENGEAYFRDLELAVSGELSRREDLVISCGGGLPLRAEAVTALKRGGLVFWLDRDPGETYDSLDLSGRPLAAGGRAAFLERYAQRAPIYRAAAHFHIPNTGAPEDAVEEVAAIYLANRAN